VANNHSTNLINIGPGDLQAFVSVAHLESFRRAATALGISQPALTARIQRLELAVRTRLFDRTTRRVTLTEGGSRLLARAEHTVNELQAIVRDLHDEAELVQGKVAFGASPTVAAALLPPLIQRFMRAHPGVRLSMVDDLAGPILEKLAAGTIDFAIIPFPGAGGDYRVEPLFVDEMRFVAPRALPIPTNKTLRFSDISDYPYVTMPRPSAVWRALAEAFTKQGKVFVPVFEANSAITLLGLVENGVGITTLPSTMLAQRDLPKVWMPRISDFHFTRQISLVTVPGRSLAPAAEAFTKVLRKSLQRR